MSYDKLDALRRANITFTSNEIPHGIQIRLSDGGILNIYSSGKTDLQGTDSPMRQKAAELLGCDGKEISGPDGSLPPRSNNEANNKVFIVYGHDADAREQLELTLRRLKLEPVVLQNVPSSGTTVIEKLEIHSEVSFACVLLTPDDEGYRRDHSEEKRYRARQNVVLELGMFLSKLGRQRVAILHKGDLELPSDIHGLLYIQFSQRVEEVRDRLAAELQEAGFAINIKDILR